MSASASSLARSSAERRSCLFLVSSMSDSKSKVRLSSIWRSRHFASIRSTICWCMMASSDSGNRLTRLSRRSKRPNLRGLRKWSIFAISSTMASIFSEDRGIQSSEELEIPRASSVISRMTCWDERLVMACEANCTRWGRATMEAFCTITSRESPARTFSQEASSSPYRRVPRFETPRERSS